MCVYHEALGHLIRPTPSASLSDCKSPAAECIFSDRPLRVPRGIITSTMAFSLSSSSSLPLPLKHKHFIVFPQPHLPPSSPLCLCKPKYEPLQSHLSWIAIWKQTAFSGGRFSYLSKSIKVAIFKSAKWVKSRCMQHRSLKVFKSNQD